MAELSDKGRKLIDLAMANDEPASVDDSWGTLVSRLTGEGLADAATPGSFAESETIGRGNQRWIWIALALATLAALAVLWSSRPPSRSPVVADDVPQTKPLPDTRATPAPAEKKAGVAAPSADELLDEAEAALAAGDPELAMTLLQQHAERAPTDPRAPQRMALRVLTLCASAQPERARDEAKAFLAAHGQSQWADAVRRSCAAQ